MHLRGLDLNLLVSLNVLLEERSITNAARRLNMSQSGTSTALLRLREFFGDEILVSSGRQMLLTPLAQSLRAPVHAIVLQAQSLIDATPGFDPAESKRRFTVMTSDYVATVFLPKVAARVAVEAPSVVLEIVPFTEKFLEPLERGDIDLLIFPSRYLTPDHPSLSLFTERYVGVSWQDNPHTKEELTLEMYLGLGHVGAKFGDTHGVMFDEWFLERFDKPRRFENSVMNFALVPLFLVGTERIATMHERLAKFYAQCLPLRIHRLPFEMPHITEALQWNRFSDRHPALIWLRGLMSDVAAKSIESNVTSEDAQDAVVSYLRHR